MDEGINSLAETTAFLTIDAYSRNQQIEIVERDRDKAMFTSNHGIYRFVRIPLRLDSSSVRFERAMDDVLASI